MYTDIDNLVREAIANRNVIEFSYHGFDRIAEPHVYGVHNGRKQILVHQTGGQSASGRLPNWRRINVDEISTIRITEQNFNARRAFPSGDESNFDEILAVTAIRDTTAE